MIRTLYLSHPTNPMPDDQQQNIAERRIATTLGPLHQCPHSLGGMFAQILEGPD